MKNWPRKLHPIRKAKNHVTIGNTKIREDCLKVKRNIVIGIRPRYVIINIIRTNLFHFGFEIQAEIHNMQAEICNIQTVQND